MEKMIHELTFHALTVMWISKFKYFAAICKKSTALTSEMQ